MSSIRFPLGRQFPIAVCLGLSAFLATVAFAQSGPYGAKPVAESKYSKIDKAGPIPGAAMGDKVVSMRKSFPTPISQGLYTNSCTAVAAAYGLRTFLERQRRGWTDEHPSRVFSPAFVYNTFCNGDNTSSVYVQNALTFMAGGGCSTWEAMPYDPNDCVTQPSNRIRREALNYKIPGWGTLDVKNIQKVKAHLASGIPVIVVAFVDPPGDWAVNNKGVTDHYSTDSPHPKHPIDSRGNCHAMVLVGYDDNKEAFELMNSWGPEWQDKGYGWIAYSFWKNWVHEGYIVPKPKPRQIGPPGTSLSAAELRWLPVGPEGVDNGNWGYSPDIKLEDVELTEDNKLPPEIKEELASVVTTEPATTPSVSPTATPSATPALNPAASPAASPATSPADSPAASPR